ncbi:MAG: DUF3892 domain-containing protein [Tessaracoccus sp.]
MAIEITHVRYGSTPRTESTITHYKWRSLSTGGVDSSTKAVLVDWIDNKGGKAYVGSGVSRVDVGVVRPAQGAPYLRTHADGKWTNNLLSLPEF